MCLEITAAIESAAMGRISPDRLSRLTGLRVSSGKEDGRSVLRFSVTGGGSCEFLSDDGASDAGVWALSQEHLPVLTEAISTLSRECGKLSFLARWIGEGSPTGSRGISGAALTKLVQENQLGNGVTYRVR